MSVENLENLENLVDIFEHLTITSSIELENLKKFQYWNFEFIKSYKMFHKTCIVYKVCFNNSDKILKDFDYRIQDGTNFCDMGCYVLRKECLKELCEINNIYGFTNRLLLCRNISYYNPVTSLHFYSPKYSEIFERPGSNIDMDRDFENNFNDEFEGEFNIEKSNIMKIIVSVICFTGDDVGSYVPEINRYYYNFDTDKFMVKEDKENKTIYF